MDTAAVDADSSSALPPAADASKARKRRWAPKVRTGCVCCRARHVKCDEARPHCRKCLASARWCDYADSSSSASSFPRAIEATDGTTTTVSRRDEQQQSVRPRHHDEGGVGTIIRETEPPDWDFVEAFRYCCQVVMPRRRVGNLPPSKYDYDKIQIAGQMPFREEFMALVTVDRILLAVKPTRALPSEVPGPYGRSLLSRFHFFMIGAIHKINSRLSDGSPPEKVLASITAILQIELLVVSATWRAHLEGFAAYVHLLGGVEGLLEAPRGSVGVALQIALGIATLTNALGPVHDQIAAFSDWTVPQIHAVFSSTYNPWRGLPTRMAVAMVQITRLRVLMAQGARPPDQLQLAASAVSRSISTFSPHAWGESFFLPDTHQTHVLGSMWKSALTLYGLLSLPPAIGTAFAHDDDDAGSRCWHELMQAVTEAMQSLEKPAPCFWPLVVLGAGLSCVGGLAAYRALLEQFLLTLSDKEEHACLYTLALRRLTRFWDSGKTSWEDCFDKPYAIL